VQLEYLKEGISTINVGQRPYEMGHWSIKVLNRLAAGKSVPTIIHTHLTLCHKDNVNACTEH